MASAKACGPARGGSTISSTQAVQGGVTVQAPVKVVPHGHGVNVTWDLRVSAWDQARANNSTPCPKTYFSSNYNYGYTWYNSSGYYSYCDVVAEVALSAYAYLFDTTTSTYYFPSNSWNGLFDDSGQFNSSYITNWTYSSSSYWAYNGSYNSTYNASFGPRGSISGHYQPTWFINGTFNPKDKIVVLAYVYGSAVSYENGFTQASAQSFFNMQTRGNSFTLDPFVVW